MEEMDVKILRDLTTEINGAIELAVDRRLAYRKEVQTTPLELQRRVQAILCSAGRERRDVVYDRLGPKYGDGAALPASKHPTASDRTTRSTRGKKDGKRKRARSVRDRQAQYGDDQILSLRVGAIEIMDAITDRNDAQKELTAEIERAALEALLATAVQVYPPPQDEWHAPARAEELKAFAAADWLIHVEDCITLATKGLKLRVARRVWRDYYRHSFARQHCADPSTEGLADQQRRRKISEEDSRRDEQERAKNHEFWAKKARNLSAWAPRGMG